MHVTALNMCGITFLYCVVCLLSIDFNSYVCFLNFSPLFHCSEFCCWCRRCRLFIVATLLHRGRRSNKMMMNELNCLRPVQDVAWSAFTLCAPLLCPIISIKINPQNDSTRLWLLSLPLTMSPAHSIFWIFDTKSIHILHDALCHLLKVFN